MNQERKLVGNILIIDSHLSNLLNSPTVKCLCYYGKPYVRMSVYFCRLLYINLQCKPLSHLKSKGVSVV